MEFNKHRDCPEEQERINDLIRLIPKHRYSILEIGSRDGYIAKLLTNHFEKVIALDLEKPEFNFKNVTPVKGNVINLEFENNSIDVVMCSEVLEHIPPQDISRACAEITRVAKHEVIIGVPCKQDIRFGRTTCSICDQVNPPWGHVSSFDKKKIVGLFNELTLVKANYVGDKKAKTNFLSALLMNIAGNPYGTYDQEEPCIHCGNKINGPPKMHFFNKLITSIAFNIYDFQSKFVKETPKWIHVLFKK